MAFFQRDPTMLVPQNKRKTYIEQTLKGFGLKLNAEDHSRLAQDKNIVISNYLDPYLAPLVPHFILKRKGEESIKFQGLVSLCFAGHISATIWDEIWMKLENKDKIFYATAKNDDLGYPLELAATHNNLNALKKLDKTYTHLLETYPKHKMSMHFALRQALESCFISEEDTSCFSYLLGMADKYASGEKTNSLSERKLAFRLDGGYMSEEETTSLFEIYIDIAKRSCELLDTRRFHYLYSYLINKFTTEEQEHFVTEVSKHLISLQEKKYSEEFCNAITGILNTVEKSVTPPSQEQAMGQATHRSAAEETPSLLEQAINSAKKSCDLLNVQSFRRLYSDLINKCTPEEQECFVREITEYLDSLRQDNYSEEFCNIINKILKKPQKRAIPPSQEQTTSHAKGTAAAESCKSQENTQNSSAMDSPGKGKETCGFFNRGQSSIPITNVPSQKSNFNTNQIDTINKHIMLLDKERKSCWPYPNKERKKEKIKGLEHLLVLAQTMDIIAAINEVEKNPLLREGHSSRTAALLDDLRNDKIQCSPR